VETSAAAALQQQISDYGGWAIYIMFYMMVAIAIWEVVARLVNKKMSFRYALDSVTSIITGPAIGLMGVGMTLLGFGSLYVFAQTIYNDYPIAQLGWTWGSFALAMLLCDLVYYLVHRAFHRVGFMWVTHTVHHSSDWINIPMAARFGPLDGFMNLAAHIPLFFFLDPAMVALCIGINQTYQGVCHTDRIHKLPAWFEFLFNTPSNHRVHHGSNPQYIDKNYAGILMCWDRMFGTFEPEVEEIRYGITKPLKYQDPITVLFHGFWRFGKKLGTVRSIKEFVFCFIMPPGYQTQKEVEMHEPLEGLTREEFEENKGVKHIMPVKSQSEATESAVV